MTVPQQQDRRGGGAHTCAHIYLAARNMLYTHAIDKDFIANLRVKAVNYLYTFKQYSGVKADPTGYWLLTYNNYCSQNSLY